MLAELQQKMVLSVVDLAYPPDGKMICLDVNHPRVLITIEQMCQNVDTLSAGHGAWV